MLRARTILLVLSAIAVCAQPGLDGPPGLDVSPPGLTIVPGNVESARAVGKQTVNLRAMKFGYCLGALCRAYRIKRLRCIRGGATT